MSTAGETVAAPKQWDAFNYANKQHLLQVVRDQSEAFFNLLEAPENWDLPITSEWNVGDLAGHMVDVIEGYLTAWDAARRGQSPAPDYNLRIMRETLNNHAQELRKVPREEILKRLRDDFGKLMDRFDELNESDWTSLMITHPYMGPVPACCYPAFQLMDYGVHAWDMHEARGEKRGLAPDVADFLVPFCFVILQGTLDTDKVTDLPHPVGVKVSGRNGGSWKVSIEGGAVQFEPGAVDDLDTVIEFDPASFVLTTFGRVRAGTDYGNREVADTFRESFFSF
ncbi:MAG TPA: maleylpyruvate isomerase N-terminal domain-containing protein [Chloroflexota bacterium]|nr:maleylpyruvate isomerase N-terminal domain-containing protein [Chloroflexota bacterium]